MEELLQKDVKFKWSQDFQESFKFLKNKLVEAPIFKFPYWSRKFHVHVDASTVAIGSFLAQPYEEKMENPNAYAIRKLNKSERNYSTTKCEALSMIFVLQKFCPYLLENPFTFFIDHQALKYLVDKPVHRGKISRWLLLFQEFEFDIIIRPGKYNV
jgi:hypothetical protein